MLRRGLLIPGPSMCLAPVAYVDSEVSMTEGAGVAVSMADLLDAYEFAEMGSDWDFGAYVCRRTGVFYFHTDEGISGIKDELPEDIDNPDLYLALPAKRELELGRSLVLDFVQATRPKDYELMRGHFQKRGAYRQFRSWSDHHGLTQDWYEFERERTLDALRGWAVENDLQILD